MRLVVKLPKDKLPFIGIILYATDLQMMKFNQDLITEHKQASYRIVFEFTGRYVNLQLISDEHFIKRVYEKLDYDAGKLRQWFHLADKSKGFHFSQLKIEQNKEMVLRTKDGNLLFVLKIEKYEILGSDAVLMDVAY
jgi:DNA topoisomerase VI subunit A